MLKLERGASPEMPLPPELQKLLDRKTLLLLVKGETGTGKTTAALELMSRLRSSGDTVHISTRTYPDKLVFQHALFSKLAAQKNIHFFSTLEFDPTQFVVAHNVVSGLHRLLSSMDNPLVVLDSWEGIADYVPPEARMKVEQSLMAVLEDTGARMVLVSEHPETNSTLDQLAEAILVLHQRVIDDRRVRELEFRKLRGVPIRQERYLFTLAGGRLRYLEPFAFTLPERTSMFRPLENTATHMSTGSRDIDALLGGGVPRGSTVLLEIRGDVPFEAQIYVPLTALLNFLATNNAVMAFPYSDYDPTRARLFATQFMPEDVYNANMRVFTTDRVDDPVAIKFSLNPTEDFDKWLGTYSAYKAEGKTIWMLMALDTVENFYGQGVMNFLATVAARAAVNKDIQSIVARPNLALTQKVANISQIHLVRPTLGPDARVSSGVPGLDDMLEGGCPAGSLITLAGRPGTGKTIFGSQFLYQGARDGGEPGMYVPMLEGRKAYFRNMTRLGLDLPPLEKKNLFRFLEMPTLSPESLPAIWEEIVRNIDEAGIVRLVIDSFTAMSQAFGTQGDIRVFTHMLLGKIIGGAGCTTLMITESAPGLLGDDNPNPGMQEFIADGVVHFHLVPVAGDARVRYVEITKMRGTNHQMGPIPIEIGNRGITVRMPHIPGRR